MKLESIIVRNFKLFQELTLPLHPQFTLLLGENGSGKTSLLDAIAIALGVWLMDIPDAQIKNQRSFDKSEIRGRYVKSGDRAQYTPELDARVTARGNIIRGEVTQWSREFVFGRRSNHLDDARRLIRSLYQQATAGEDVLLPVIAYYGAGRTWQAHRERRKKDSRTHKQSSRWAAFYDCLNERIRVNDLKRWFRSEETARGRREGKYRPGFEVVRRAVMGCVPGADDVFFDPEMEDIVFSIDGNAQPSNNLSAGQRTMLALVADIAIRAVTQNNFLVPPDELPQEDHALPKVLAETPGVVLIDELDVHLHPRWQRRVVSDLKTTFPNMQFVCTTHSPQVVGEIPPDEIRLLDSQVETPKQAFGMDSNWILEVLMNAADRNNQVEQETGKISELITAGEIENAKEQIRHVRNEINGTSGDLDRAEALLERMRLLGK